MQASPSPLEPPLDESNFRTEINLEPTVPQIVPRPRLGS